MESAESEGDAEYHLILLSDLSLPHQPALSTHLLPVILPKTLGE